MTKTTSKKPKPLEQQIIDILSHYYLDSYNRQAYYRNCARKIMELLTPPGMSKKTDWEKEFDQIFGATLWQEHKYEFHYKGKTSQYVSCGEKVKDFIREVVAKEKMELVEKIRDFVDERNCWILKDGDRFISEGELVTFLASLSKEEVGGYMTDA